ncbi:hypothetical protein MHYP_G00204750 [Metynnis hypsauchen]
MKILLIFIFCLMSVGDGASREVTGYSGGGILFKCKYQKESEPNSLYFCRSSGSNCDELIKIEAKDKRRNSGRFSLFDNSTAAVLQVLITELTVEDSGRYQCGADNDSSTSVDLNVQKDRPFEKSISVIGRAGGGVNISCKYPQPHRNESKFLCKRENNNNTRCNSRIFVKQSRKWKNNGNFSVFDDPEQQIFTVTINSLTEEDSGEYWCGVESDWKSHDGHRVYITQISLTVTDDPVSPPPAFPASSLISAVCVMVLLLLTGLLFFIFTLRKRHRTQSPALSPSQSAQISSNSHTVLLPVCDHEKIKDSRRLSDSSPINSTAQLPPNPSDPPETVYDNVQLPTIPCDSSHPLNATQTPSISPDQNIYSSTQLPTILSDSSAGDTQLSSGTSAEGPTYATLSFSKTAASSTDAVTAGTFRQEEDSCDYATVNHGMRLA